MAGYLSGVPSSRMRRVNEALREVLSEAILELKDPRIGFVTVTGVKTTPTAACDRVRQRARRRDKRAAHAGGARGRARRAPGAHRPRAPAEADPQLAFEYDPSVERGVRMTQLIDELAPDDPDGADATAADLAAVAEAIRAPRPLPRHDAREPGRRRARVAPGDAPRAAPARQGQRHVPRRRPRRSPASTGSCALDELRRELPGRRGRARRCVAVDCANESRLGPDPEVLHGAPFVAQHRPPPRQHALRGRQPRRRRRVVDRRGAARRVRRARGRDHAGDRGAALHRRSSPTRAASSTRTRRRRRCGWPRSSSRRAPTCTRSSRASTSRSSSRS